MMSEQILETPTELSEADFKDGLLKTILRLEACLQTPSDTLHDLAEEQKSALLSEKLDLDRNEMERTEFFRIENTRLDKEALQLDTLIRQYEKVEKELIQASNSASADTELSDLNKRKKGCVKVFKQIKELFVDVLAKITKEYPNLQIENTLQALTDKLMENPSSPYISTDHLQCSADTLNFLLLHNMVTRHPRDCTLFKLKDPRPSSLLI